jgi:hypothetical protein
VSVSFLNASTAIESAHRESARTLDKQFHKATVRQARVSSRENSPCPTSELFWMATARIHRDGLGFLTEFEKFAKRFAQFNSSLQMLETV